MALLNYGNLPGADYDLDPVRELLEQYTDPDRQYGYMHPLLRGSHVSGFSNGLTPVLRYPRQPLANGRQTQADVAASAGLTDIEKTSWERIQDVAQIRAAFQHWSRRYGSKDYYGPTPRVEEGQYQVLGTEDMMSYEDLNELRRTGGLESVAGIPGETRAMPGVAGGAVFTGDYGDREGDKYYGVSNNWDDEFSAVALVPFEPGMMLAPGQRETPAEGDLVWVVREAIYEVGSAESILKSLTDDELKAFRLNALEVEKFEELRGGGFTDGTFGRNRDLGDADIDLMEYFLGYANENGTSWQSAATTLGGQAADINEETDKANQEPPPLEKYTETTYALSDMDYARRVMTEVMRKRMGRDPTDREVRRYLAKLNAQETANPSVSVYTYGYNEYDQRTDTTVLRTPAEIDRVDIADDQANTKRAKESQTARLFETIMDELASGR